MKIKIWVIAFFLSLAFFSIFALPIFAASSDFLPGATKFYKQYCTGKKTPQAFTISCYLFDKVKELETKIDNLGTRVVSLESNDNSQATKIAELTERIRLLEITPTLTLTPTPTSTPSPTPSTMLPFNDNFDSGNTDKWEILGGNWQVVGGQLVGSGNAIPMPIALVKNLIISDYIVELDMTSVTRVDKLVFVRFKDANNYIVLNFRAARPLTLTDVVIEEVVNGITTRFIPEFAVLIPTHQLGEQIHVRIEGKGNSIKIWVNNTQVLNNSYVFTSMEGKIGVGVFNSNTNSFDNVAISNNP